MGVAPFVFIMDHIFGQSTWFLLLGNLLLLVLKFFFSLTFSSFDSQPTQPLSKENTGFPIALNLFYLMNYIHDQLTQLFQNKNILFIFISLLAFVFFFMFFIVAYIYHRRSIRNQPLSSQFCSLYVFKSHLFHIFSHLFVLQSFQTRA